MYILYVHGEELLVSFVNIDDDSDLIIRYRAKIKNLSKFYEYGVRMITVLHDHNNEIGFNQRSLLDGPLTPFGIKVIDSG